MNNKMELINHFSGLHILETDESVYVRKSSGFNW